MGAYESAIEWLITGLILGFIIGHALGRRRVVLESARDKALLSADLIRVADLSLRLESKHNALKIAVRQRDEALENLRQCWQDRTDERKALNNGG